MSQDEQKGMRQLLTFRLDRESYAVDVDQVREVLDCTEASRIPQTPDYMLGVINLRGNVVPVVDLRLRFCLEETVATRDSCIIVMEVHLDGELVVVGSLVDAVEEVFDMPTDEIGAAPRLGSHVNVDFIRGVGKRGENFVMILDIDRIFSSEEVEFFHSSQQEPSAQAG